MFHSLKARCPATIDYSVSYAGLIIFLGLSYIRSVAILVLATVASSHHKGETETTT